MKRKIGLLIAGCVLLLLTLLKIDSALAPRCIGQGRIHLELDFDYPTHEPAVADFDSKMTNWISSQLPMIEKLLRDPERMKTLIRKSEASEANIEFVTVCPIRGSLIYEVRFAGGESNSVWRVASNACVMLTEYYTTNRLSDFAATNHVRCVAEHIETGYWAPIPLWRQMLNNVEKLLPR